MVFLLLGLVSLGNLSGRVVDAVLRPPPERSYIWCIQSPFDNREVHVLYLDGGSVGVRVTLVNGREAHLFRFNGFRPQEVEIEGFASDTVFQRVPGDKVFLLVEGEAPRVIEAESVLETEILEAYAAMAKPLSDADVFILELLKREEG